MGRKVLIDTNIAIAYIGNNLSFESMNKLDKIFNDEYHLSVINKIELLGYPVGWIKVKRKNLIY